VHDLVTAVEGLSESDARGYYLQGMIRIYTKWGVSRGAADEVSSSGEAAKEAVDLPMQSMQQVVHVLGWALSRIAKATFPKFFAMKRDKTEAEVSFIGAIDAVQLESAKMAAESEDAVYYKYSLDRQTVDHEAVRKGLRYVRLPVVKVFFLVELVCIKHFDPGKIARDSYMRASRQGLSSTTFPQTLYLEP